MPKKKPAHLPPITKKLFGVVGAMLFVGLVVVASSTSVYSQSVYGTPYKFAILHMAWVLVGLLGFFFFYRVDYSKLQNISYIMFGAALVLLLFLAIVGILPCNSEFSFSPCVNGANRWLYLNPAPLPAIPFLGVLGFQPSEFAKLSLILYLSVQITKNIKRKEDLFLVYLVISGLFALLVLLQPNMSTAGLIFIIGSIIYFSADAHLGTMVKVMPVVICLAAALVLLSPYRRQRLNALLNLNTDDTSYHMEQILISLGSGGVTGVGFGRSMQKHHYLPEVASDSIFAIIGEEFGFIGTSSLVLLFSYFIYAGFTIAKGAPDMLGRLLAVGITSWVGLQFFINTAAMTGLIPLTGVPIPLISYGGSSMVFSLMGLGVLASVSREVV
jgi:cell division protein FtsW